MPTYEYACKKCGENLEVFQSFSAKPLKKHDGCGGDLQKVFHARGVVFKGSGFYKTDSRKAASDNGKSEDKPAAEKKSESKSTSKADTKSTAKATSTTEPD